MVLHNAYGAPTYLFATSQGEIFSREGTTQGDPLAMSLSSQKRSCMACIAASHPATCPAKTCWGPAASAISSHMQ